MSNTGSNMIDTTYLQENEVKIVQDIVNGEADIGQPFSDLLLIKLYKDPEKTSGGIYIPDVAKDNLGFNVVSGLVLAIGPDCFKTGKYANSNEPGCKVGDWVVCSYKTPNRYKYEDMTLIYTYDDCIFDRCKNPTKVKRG